MAFSGYHEHDRPQAAQSKDKRNEALLEAGEENCAKQPNFKEMLMQAGAPQHNEDLVFYFNCPDLMQHSKTIFRVSAANPSEITKISLPEMNEKVKFNMNHSRMVQNGEDVLVFKKINTQIHGWKIKGIESGNLDISSLAPLELEAEDFSLVFDGYFSVYLTGGSKRNSLGNPTSLSNVYRLDLDSEP